MLYQHAQIEKSVKLKLNVTRELRYLITTVEL